MIVILIVILLMLLCIIAGYMMFVSVLDQNFDKKKKPVKKKPITDDPKSPMYPTHVQLARYLSPRIAEMKKMEFEKLEVSSFDGLLLYGELLRGNPKEVVILVHGYKSCKENDFSDKIEIYRKRNSTILLVNDRSHGHSKGRYIGFSELDRFDVKKWVEKINEMFDEPSIYLHGVSMGGATVIHCADMHLKNVKGIVDDCGFDTIETECRYMMKNMYHLPYFPIGNIASFFSKVIARVDFRKSSGERIVSHTDIPIAFIHGKEDRFVPCFMSENMAKVCSSPHELLLVEGAGHSAAYMMAKEEYTSLVNRLLDGDIR